MTRLEVYKSITSGKPLQIWDNYWGHWREATDEEVLEQLTNRADGPVQYLRPRPVYEDGMVRLEDGYYYFGPPERLGVYSASLLREVADDLDQRNAAWNRMVTAGLQTCWCETHNRECSSRNGCPLSSPCKVRRITVEELQRKAGDDF